MILESDRAWMKREDRERVKEEHDCKTDREKFKLRSTNKANHKLLNGQHKPMNDRICKKEIMTLYKSLQEMRERK